MTGDAEAKPRAMCRATTTQGRPCRKLAVEGGLCVFHSGKLDLAKLGRRGGLARGQRKQEEPRGERLTRLAWGALEELLASDTPATAKVRAASELLDRLEPLLAKNQMDVGRELAEEMGAATVSARAKLTAMLDRQAKASRSRPGTRAEREWWAAELGRVLADLERVVIDPSGVEPIVRYAEVDIRPVLRGLVERGLIAPANESREFEASVEARARELTAEAERRAREAEARGWRSSRPDPSRELLQGQ